MCTSIVTMTKDGELIHGRNLDFAFSDFLRNYTIQLDCQRNGYVCICLYDIFRTVGVEAIFGLLYKKYRLQLNLTFIH